MAATLAGAFKALLEAQGWGLPWYRDGAPLINGAPMLPPFGVIQEGIGTVPERHGDYHSPTAHQGDTELVQIDLYQPALRPSSPGRMEPAERRELPSLVRKVLHGALVGTVYGTPPLRIYGTIVDGGRRWPVSDNVTRHTWTVRVRRDA